MGLTQTKVRADILKACIVQDPDPRPDEGMIEPLAVLPGGSCLEIDPSQVTSDFWGESVYYRTSRPSGWIRSDSVEFRKDKP